MPAWIYVLAACAVGFVVFVVVFHPFRKGAHAAPRALPVRVDAGSMVLAEEHTAWLSAPPWAAPRCVACASTDCPGITGGVDACPRWRAAEERNERGEYLTTVPVQWRLGAFDGQLGPRARAVLAAYDARCVERWGHAIAG